MAEIAPESQGLGTNQSHQFEGQMNPIHLMSSFNFFEDKIILSREIYLKKYMEGREMCLRENRSFLREGKISGKDGAKSSGQRFTPLALTISGFK